MRKVNGRQMTDDRRRTPSYGKSSGCLWQGELKKNKKKKERKKEMVD
jgi:hypothetical protein